MTGGDTARSRPGADRHYDGQPSGLSRPEAGLQLADSVVTVRPGECPGPGGSELVVIVIDPPLFGPDGVALAGTTVGRLLREGRPGWLVPDGSTP